MSAGDDGVDTDDCTSNLYCCTDWRERNFKTVSPEQPSSARGQRCKPRGYNGEDLGADL